LVESLPDFLIRDGYALWNTFHQVATFDFHGARLLEGISRTDLDLDLLGRTLADQQIIFSFDVWRDRFIHLISRHLLGSAMYYTGQGNHRDFGRATADIDDHVAGGFGYGKTRADGCRHCLLHQMSFARFCAIRGILHGPLLDLRDSGRNTDHDARVSEHLPAVRLLNEVRQHLLRDCKVGDNAIFHRPDSHDIAGRPAKHVLRLLTYRFRLVV